MSAVAHVCATCGSQYPPTEAPPASCATCRDDREYAAGEEQRWTSLAELRADHENRIEADGELVGIGTEPMFGIGQRALLVPHGERQVLWDCVTLLDDATEAEVRRRGGLAAVAISHPHYYASMVEWAERFGCPVLVHADDAGWIPRPHPSIVTWSGESYDLGEGLTIVRCGGHFVGACVLHWAGGAGGAGAVLSGDTIHVVPDRRHVGFMWSFPNLVPLPATAVGRIRAALEPYPFEALYGAWWEKRIDAGAHEAVQRAAGRYARALEGAPGA